MNYSKIQHNSVKEAGAKAHGECFTIHSGNNKTSSFPEAFIKAIPPLGNVTNHLEAIESIKSQGFDVDTLISGVKSNLNTQRKVYSPAPPEKFHPQGGNSSREAFSNDPEIENLRAISDYISETLQAWGNETAFPFPTNEDTFPPDVLRAAIATKTLPLITCWCGDYAVMRCSHTCPILYCSDECRTIGSPIHECAEVPPWYNYPDCSGSVPHGTLAEYVVSVPPPSFCSTCNLRATYHEYCSTECLPSYGFHPEMDPTPFRESTEQAESDIPPSWTDSIFNVFKRIKEFISAVALSTVDFMSKATLKLWSKGIVDTIKAAFKNTSNSALIVIIALIFAAVLGKVAGSILTNLIAVIIDVFKMIVLTICSTAGMFVKVLTKTFKHMQEEVKFEPQSSGQEDGGIALLATILSSATLVSAGGAPSLRTIGSSIAFARNIKGGLSEASSGFLWLLEKLPGFVQDFLFQNFGILQDSGDVEAMLDVENLRRDLITIQKSPGPTLTDPDFCDLFISRYVSVSSHCHDSKNGWTSQKRTMVSSLLKEASTNIGQAQSTCDNNERREPLGIILKGEPGSGKTQMIHAIAAHFFYKYPKKQLFFWKNLNDQYWSGYGNQKIVLLDDLFATNDEKAEADVVVELLRLISPGDMPLNMPFAGKGNTFFVSGIIIITTNRDMNVPLKIATDYRAFMRRFLCFTVTVKNQYKDSRGIVDVGKLALLTDAEKASFPHIVMRLKFLKSAQQFKETQAQGVFLPQDEVLTFDESLLIMRAEMLKKERNAVVADDIIAHIKKEKRAEEEASLQALSTAVATTTPLEALSNVSSTLRPYLGQKVMAPDEDHRDAVYCQKAYGEDNADDKFKPQMNRYAEEGLDYKHNHEPLPEMRPLGYPDPDYKLDSDSSTDEPLDMNNRKNRPVVDFVSRDHLTYTCNLPLPSNLKLTSGGNRFNNRRRNEIKKAEEKLATSPNVPALDAAIRFINECDVSPSPYDEHRLKTILNPETTWQKILKSHLNKAATSPYLIPIGCVVTACSALAAILKIVKTTSNFFGSESYGGPKANRDQPRRRANLTRMPGSLKGGYQPQSDAYTTAIRDKIMANTGFIESGGCKQGMTIIGGTILRTATHFFKAMYSGEWMPDGEVVTIHVPEGGGFQTYQWAFNLNDMRLSETIDGLASDLCFINCKRLFPSKSNIVTHHVSEKELSNRRIFSKAGIVTRLGCSSIGSAYVVYDTSKFIKYSASNACEDDIIVPAQINININTQKGQCGESVVAEVNGVDKIVGSHSGSKSGVAYSTIVTKEMCQAMMDFFNDNSDFVNQFYQEPFGVEFADVKEINGAYVPIGYVTDAPRGCSNKTKLRPSVIKDSVPGSDTMEPALLGHPSDTRSTLTTKMLLYDVLSRTVPNTRPICSNLMDKAVDSIFDECRRFPPSFKLGVLPLSECLNGNDQLNGYPMSGSPGYPCTLVSKGVKGKYAIISVDDETGLRTITHEPTMHRWEQMGDMLRRGVVPYIPFTKVLKDEALPIKKILEPKTRGIEPVDIVFNLHLKAYFGSMLAWLQEVNANVPFKVGMNVYSPQWDGFVRRHLCVGAEGFDGDIKTQECMIRSEVYDAIYDFTDRVYAEFGETPTLEERRARRALLCRLLHSYVMMGNALYRTKFGNPSGNFITAFICSFTSGCLLRASYFVLADIHQPDLSSSFAYNVNVKDSLAGDDNIVTRSKRVAHFFTGANVSDVCLRKWGIHYTDSSKSSVYPPDKSFFELSFLSNVTRSSSEFADMGVQYLPVLGDSSKIKCASFIRTSAANGDAYIATVDNANSLLRLVATSGREEFKKTRDMLYRGFNDYGYSPDLIDYVMCTKRFRDDTLDLDDPNDLESKFIPHSFAHKAQELLLHPSKILPTLSRGADMLGAHSTVRVSVSELRLTHPIDLPGALKVLDERVEALKASRVDGDFLASTLFDRAGITSTTPIIVRQVGYFYEILEGNGRVKALQLAGCNQFLIDVRCMDPLGVSSADFHPQMDGLNLISSSDTQTGGGQPLEVKDTSNTGEGEYTFSSFVNREQLISSVLWSSTNPQHTILSSFNAPFGLIGRTTRDAVAKFVYLKCGVSVRVQVQSNAFQQGMLSVVFCPLYGVARTLKYQLNSLASISVAPNMQLMAGATSEVTFTIPYIHPYNALNTANSSDSEFETLGTLSIVVFNPLRTGVGCQETCTVNVYARLTDAELTIPRPPPSNSGFAAPMYRGVTPTRRPVVSRPPVRRAFNPQSFEPQMDNISKVLTGAIDAVSTVSALVPLLDVPSDGSQPVNYLRRAAPYLNNTQNQVHYANVMDDNPGQVSMPNPSDIGTDSQETAFSHAMTLPCFINTITHKVDDLEGDVLAKIPMCPVVKTLNADADDIVQVPLCEYMALQYALWRGSLKLKVQVICTSIQTGRLAICSHYGCSSDDVAFEDIMSQNCTIMEYGNGSNSITVDIPYRSNHPWLGVPTYSMSNGGVGPAVDYLNYMMGELSIRVVTRMATMASVAQQVDINLYYCCGDDIRFAYQSSRFVDYSPVLEGNHRTLPPVDDLDEWDEHESKCIERFEPQMMMGEEAAPAEIKDDQDTVTLSNSSQNAQGGTSYEANQSDFLTLTRRFTAFMHIPRSSSPADIVMTTGDPFVRRVPLANAESPMCGGLWSSLPFVVYSGGMRMVIRCESDLTMHADRGTQMANTPYPYIKSGVSGAGPVDYLTAENGFTTMQFPMTIPNKFMIIPKNEADAKNDLCSAASLIIHATAGSRQEFTAYAATADHMHFSLLSFVPHVHVSPTPFFRHVRSYQPNLPEFALMLADPAGMPWPFTQASTLTYLEDLVPNGLIGQQPDSVRVPVDILDDAQVLSYLGITAPASRVYNSGQTQVVKMNFVTSFVKLHTSEIGVVPGPPGIPVNFGLDDDSVIPLGTAIQVSGQSGAPGWKLTAQAYANADVRILLAIATNEIALPAPGLSYGVGITADQIAPLTAAAVPFQDGELYNWDSDPGHLKSFYDTLQVPFSA